MTSADLYQLSASVVNKQQRADPEIITAINDLGQLYPIGKLDAHVRDVRHLAISVFLFNAGRLLMQQRADGKYHSGGLWANTCCSHPRWNESLPDCAQRRLAEEVGCRLPLTHFGLIDYATPVGDLFENEAAHCYVGYMDDTHLPIGFNTDEVKALRWQTLDQLQTDLGNRPGDYSPWILIYLKEHYDLIASVAHPHRTTERSRTT